MKRQDWSRYARFVNFCVFLFVFCFSQNLRASPRGNCTPEKMFCVFFSPSDSPVFAVNQYLNLAKRSIRIAAYQMDVKEFIPVILTKLNANVRVELLLDFKSSLVLPNNPVWYSLKPHPNLIRYRVPSLRGGMNPQMNNKIILIDDEILIVGSADWTYGGLAGNYENILVVRDPLTIKKYSEELDELKNTAHVSCEIFSQSKAACGQGNEVWDSGFRSFATTGKLPAGSTVSNPSDVNCNRLEYGLLDFANQPPVANLSVCFNDQRFVELAKRVSELERWSDDSPVRMHPNRLQHVDTQVGRVKTYFNPEDNIEKVVGDHLEKTLQNPRESFVYMASNFVSNKKIAETLAKLHVAGVRMKIFMDRGRQEDENFQSQLELLKPLGFTKGLVGVSSEKITLFDPRYTGPNVSNNNKFIVIGAGRQLFLLTTSATFSLSSMRRNDDNLLVIEDSRLAAIYLREALSQLYVYRYLQQENSAGYKDDVDFLSTRVPCMRALLGIDKSCSASMAGSTAEWVPFKDSSVLLSIGNVPIDRQRETLWVWSPQLGARGGAMQLLTHDLFMGRWITSVSLPPTKKTLQFKFFKMPVGADPNRDGNISRATWEYPGQGNERSLPMPLLPVHGIRNLYTWGQVQ